MKSVILARVSSREQEETGYSLPAQEKFLSDYAVKRQLEIFKCFSISESASGRRDREIFNEMMDFIQKEHIKIIICEKVDRLTRNFKDAVMIDEWLEKDEERQVHLVKDSLVLHKNSRSQEKLNWGIRIIFSKNYIDNLSEEVKKGQREKVAQGWLPTKPPLGYKTTGEDGHRIHVLDENKAPLVEKMFEFYVTGRYSTKKLADVMREEGLRTHNGNELVKSRLHDLLTEPFYYGMMKWNGDLYPGKHEPIIDKETFDKVQEILQSKTTPKYNKHFFLFKGMIHCVECEGLITWEKQKGIHYGHCNHYKNCAQKAWSKERQVEAQLLDTFDSLRIKSPRLAEWIRKALKESHQDRIEYHTASITELNQRLAQLDRRLHKLYDDKLDEKITKEFYELKFKQYSNEKEEAVHSLEKHSQADTKYSELGINFYELSQRGKEIYLKATDAEKRQLLQIVFLNLILDEGKLSFTYSQPFELLSNAVRSTNSSKVRNFERIQDFTFEPIKMPETSMQKDISGTRRPIWLPG